MAKSAMSNGANPLPVPIHDGGALRAPVGLHFITRHSRHDGKVT
jgi:hypothetical protein